MISTNSLAAFTAEVSRATGPAQARAAGENAAASRPRAVETSRKLEALPPPPSSPLPRGSLLDLKV